MTDATPYTVPKEPGRWQAITLAALVHAALVAFLWIGVRWQSETPVAIEAEVWSPEVREAAPRPVPEPVKEPEPKPEVKEAPKREVAPPKPKVEEPPVAKPDIALEQEKKRKAREEKKRRDDEQLAKQKQKEEDERKAKLKKQDEQRLAQQKADEKQKLDKVEKEKKLAAEKKRQQVEAEAKRKQEQAEEQALDKMRNENMQRMLSGVTGTGGAGTAAKSQGSGRADASYAQRVGAKIKSNINFNVPDGMSANSPVEFEVNLLPDGSIAGLRMNKSSGVPGFDEAVRRAIERSQPYPKDQSGSVPSSFTGIHRPKDQ